MIEFWVIHRKEFKYGQTKKNTKYKSFDFSNSTKSVEEALINDN